MRARCHAMISASCRLARRTRNVSDINANVQRLTSLRKATAWPRKPIDAARECGCRELLVTTMKTKLTVLTVALLSVCLLMRPSAMAIGISIELGDRPYYTEGPTYWDDGYLWVWVPGHWSEH